MIAILNSGLALAVYLRMVVPMFKPAEDAVPMAKNPVAILVWGSAMRATLELGLLATLFMG